MKEPQLAEKIILERFGDPIGELPTYYGVPDERAEPKKRKRLRKKASLLQ
jgi:hypothetical protein